MVYLIGGWTTKVFDKISESNAWYCRLRTSGQWLIFKLRKGLNDDLSMVRMIFEFIYSKGLNIMSEMQVNGAVMSNWQGNE
jgi:hypothetical protein